MAACTHWHRLAGSDAVWSRLLAEREAGSKPMPSRSYIHVWECSPRLQVQRSMYKCSALYDRVSQRFYILRKGYEFLRLALDAWWGAGHPEGSYNSAVVRRVLRKLTSSDWSLLYEALSTAFTDRADQIACDLRSDLDMAGLSRNTSPSGSCTTDDRSGGLESCLEAETGDEALEEEPWEKRRRRLEDWDVWPDSERPAEARRGRRVSDVRLWSGLLQSWQQYKRWLVLIAHHCPGLQFEVMVERARFAGVSATPTVFDKGMTCFRSNVLLSYGLRRRLQESLSWLTIVDTMGDASDVEVDILIKGRRVYQELDVLDDFTLPKVTFTQEKLQRCFHSLAGSTTSKANAKLLKA
eukprot:SM000223S07302  [mRNA]  locus=s223:55417:57097:- [translate_table: standard]